MTVAIRSVHWFSVKYSSLQFLIHPEHSIPTPFCFIIFSIKRKVSLGLKLTWLIEKHKKKNIELKKKISSLIIETVNCRYVFVLCRLRQASIEINNWLNKHAKYALITVNILLLTNHKLEQKPCFLRSCHVFKMQDLIFLTLSRIVWKVVNAISRLKIGQEKIWTAVLLAFNVLYQDGLVGYLDYLSLWKNLA